MFPEYKQIKMKIDIIILVLHYAADSQSSCVLQNKFVNFISTRHKGLNETRPLTDLIKCKEIKKKLKSFFTFKTKDTKLQCKRYFLKNN